MQTTKKRIILVLLTMILTVSGSMVTYAQTSTEALHNAKQQLEQKQRVVEQKAQEKQTVNQEIGKIQQELNDLYNDITKNKEAMAQTQQKIDATNQLIEKKKQDIVVLEDKILARKGIMKQRAVSLQQTDNIDVIINLFFDSDSITDFIQRASAVSALMDADKDILGSQKKDLLQIEEDKKEIDRQEQILLEDQKALANQQQTLDQNMQKRQQALTVMQQKYSQILKQMALAEQEKAGIESQMKDIQAKIKQEQDAAKARTVSKTKPAATEENETNVAINGKEMYVTATAYSPEESGNITAAGYNIGKHPNMKLIAVDPRVIPLGKKVWVEGYGVAVAGDTGGAIKGHKIDVLMPTRSKCLQFGRKTVKIIVLD
ncbi:cell wall-binding protein [Bacillus sp. sid0103]|uniref:3D domain-containing protein n=1 Tax=Bacillus sp. sid0103 TaxID=2856337 RepID=UPI001C487240|nr:3D domain-containing protein [Bacillus sp. sid0103]MBV7505254.1 cell wall-binding protein [Bacillus sp. sid0103]